jgi:hypothetical protein
MEHNIVGYIVGYFQIKKDRTLKAPAPFSIKAHQNIRNISPDFNMLIMKVECY